MMSASGRIEHAMLNTQNFRDFFPELKPHAAETPITEWVMTVGIINSCLRYQRDKPVATVSIIQLSKPKILILPALNVPFIIF